MPNEQNRHEVPPLKWHSEAQPTPDQLAEQYDDKVRDATVAAVRRYEQDEPRVTAEFVDAIPEGARPHGLEYRMKSPESLARKIADKADTKGIEPAQAAQSLNDVVREHGSRIVASVAGDIHNAQRIVLDGVLSADGDGAERALNELAAIVATDLDAEA